MKKIFVIVVAALMFIACSENKQPETVAQEDTRIDSLQRIIEQKDNEMNDVIATFNEIQEGFRLIENAERNVTIVKNGEAVDKSEQIRQSVQNIQQRMQHNRELIQKLQQQLREGTTRSEELRRTIASFTKELESKDEELQKLRAELEQKDIHIAELDQTVTTLNSSVNELKEETAKQTETITTQDKQLHTAYYVFGTKRELQDQNIYNKGKVLQSNFNKNYFTKIDIRVDKEIKLYSKHAELLSSHPAGTYTLQQDAQKQYVLRITNPQQFWSTSKYLVILVK